MANYTRNNTQKKVNTTTRIISIFNREGEDAGALQMGYWNNMATFAIAPMIPAKKGQDVSFDFENAPSVVVNAETMVTLNQGIDLLNKDILRAKKTDTARKIIYVSVECQVQGEVYRLEVGHGNEEREVEGYYIALAVLDKNDEEADVMVYQFDFEKGDRNQTLFIGTPGGKESAKAVGTQFKTFCSFVELSATFLNVGHAQGANINTDWKNSRVDYTLEIIKGLLESSIAGGGRSGGDGEGSGRRSGGFGSSRRRGAGRTRGGGEETSTGGRGRRQRTVKEETSTDIDDIENEMEDVDIDDME